MLELSLRIAAKHPTHIQRHLCRIDLSSKLLHDLQTMDIENQQFAIIGRISQKFAHKLIRARHLVLCKCPQV
jgi:hypothetical protein